MIHRAARFQSPAKRSYGFSMQMTGLASEQTRPCGIAIAEIAGRECAGQGVNPRLKLDDPPAHEAIPLCG